MSHIIAVRHGVTRPSYSGSPDEPLSREGNDQMLVVARAAKSISDNFCVVSSNKRRTRLGAETIIEELGLPYDYPTEERLSNEKFLQGEVEEITRKYTRDGSNVIFVAHSEFVGAYGTYLSSMFGTVFNTDTFFGRGFHADISNKTLTHFP